MNRTLTGIVCSLLILGASGCRTPDGPPRTEDQVPRIELEAARAAIEGGRALVVDVRSAEAYAAGHIPGAVSIPLERFEDDLQGIGLERERWIITYCT